jgi:phosphohistidine swiveling domain-containing protein
MNKYLYFPNNYEFAVSKNQIYLTKITPHTPQTETVATTRIFFTPPSPQKPPTHREWKEILTGKSLSRGAKIGHVKIINKIGDLHKIRHGDIVVAHSLSSPMFSAFRKSGAVILEKTPFQHNDYSFIIKSGIPIISDVQNASKLLYENQLVMVASKEGKVYSLN